MSFNTPQSITETIIEKIGVAKCELSLRQLIVLGFMAGAFIAFGSQLATRVLATVADPGLAMILAGAVFSVGLMLVIIAGAELFTGNTLIWMSVLSGKTTLKKMLVNWIVVFFSNFAGTVFIAWLISQSGLLYGADGTLSVIGNKAVSIAAIKAGLPFFQVLIRGILCNWLVCLALWISLASHDITGKIFGIFFPIMTFVASGFEHNVANMYFLSVGMMIDPATCITPGGFVNNLIAATLGNIIGGAFFVGTLYYYVYRKCETCKSSQ